MIDGGYEVYWNGEHQYFENYYNAMEYAKQYTQDEESPRDIAYIIRHTRHHHGIHSVQWMIKDIYIVEHLI